MSEKRKGTASLTLNRPEAPISTRALDAALTPLLELLNCRIEDVETIHVRQSSIRVVLIPTTRGRRQHDARVGVTYPIVFDDDDQE